VANGYGLPYLGAMASARRNLPIFARVPKPEPAGQQTFFKMPNPFDLELWQTYAKYLSAHGRDLDKKEEQLTEKCGWEIWDIGDLLLEGEEGGLSMKKLRKEAEQFWPKRKWKTLRNYKVTSKAIESSRRRDGREGRPSLPYSLHQVVEQFEPEVQDYLLERAGEPGALSGLGFRKLVRELRQCGKVPPSLKAEKACQAGQVPKHYVVEVKLSPGEARFLEALRVATNSNNRHPTLAIFLHELLTDHLRANEKLFKAFLNSPLRPTHEIPDLVKS
jgi:hypothetical protein